MSLLSKLMKLTALANAIVVPNLTAEETYIISLPGVAEWQPPVEKEVVFPDVKVTKTTVQQDGVRHICLEECEAPKEAISLASQQIEEETQQFEVKDASIEVLEEEYVAPKLVTISASVHFENDKPFTHLRVNCEGERVVAWSSMNFSEMAGVINYSARGIEYHTLCGHGVEQNVSASEAGCPTHRDKLNQEKARFVVIGEKDENSAALEALRGMHALYNQEREALETAYQKRLVNLEKQRAWEEANPPKVKDLRIQYWIRDAK